MRIFPSIILLSLFNIFAHAQEYSFKTITTDNGLSQNDVNAIIRDSRGFMWFATYDGLNKYDGYEFTTYRNSPKNEKSICGNLIHSIAEGSDHDLWVTTENSGLSRIDLITDEIENIRNTKETPDALLTNRLGDIACFPNGSIWLESLKGTIFLKYNNPGNYTKKYFQNELLGKILETKLVRSFAKKTDTSLMLVTHGGLIIVNLTETFEPSYDINIIQHSHNTFECVIPCPDGFIIGMIDGLFLLRYSNLQANEYVIDKISDIVPISLCIDNGDKLWAGSTDGIYLYSYNKNNDIPYTFQKHFTTKNSNLTSNYIRCIYSDNTGILWFGTNGGGVCMLDQNKANFRHYPYITDKTGQQYKPKIRTIYQDLLGGLWIGTENYGLFHQPFNRDKDYHSTYSRYQPNKNAHWHGVYDIAGVHTYRGNYLWAGCSFNNVLNELDLTQMGKKNFIRPLQGVKGMAFQIQQDSDSIIWIASYWGGVSRYNPYKKDAAFDIFTDENSNIPSNTVRSIMEDNKGRIWIGTSNGLCFLNKSEKHREQLSFHVFQATSNNVNSISHNYILPICQTSNDDIWIGTMGGGINKYVEPDQDDYGNFESYTTNDGLPNNIIKEIIEDDHGNLWIASNKGLSRMNPVTLEITNYDKSDGLQDNEFCELGGCKLYDGEILFGGVNGFNAFYPHEIKEDSTLPSVALTGLYIMGTKININDTINGRVILNKHLNELNELTLKYNENNFSIYFSGLHYSSPLKNQYQYFLEGFDSKWSYTQSNARFAKYTNVEPGVYTLKVIASNASNKWNLTAKELHITIQPPFWRSWIFRLSIGALALFALFITYRLRVSHLTRELIRRKEHEKVLTQAKAKAEESDNLKTSIIANISHEIRTPVNGIVGFSELLAAEHLAIDKKKRYIKIVRQKSKELMKILDSIIMLSAAQTGSVKVRSEERAIELSINSAYASAEEKIIALEKNITISVVSNNAILKRLIKTDHHKILVILNNLLDNAVKFTDSGEVEINCEIKDNQLIYSVRDTGIGISDKYKDIIFEDFRQSSTGLNREYEGIGLGLSLCKAYVNMLEGEIWFESVQNEGTTFYFSVPL